MQTLNNDALQTQHVFILSDGTGITAQHLAHSLMSQFEQIDFICTILPYIDTHAKAEHVAQAIKENFKANGKKPIVFMTLVNTTISSSITQSPAVVFDLFSTFLAPLELSLGCQSSHTIGRSHGLQDAESYQKRLDAVHYTLDHDDGIKTSSYPQADVIIIGVSRCGKTPTSLYLAMQYGLRIANYPLTEDDDATFSSLPTPLKPFVGRGKLFGLTIDAERLHHIRQERRPNSRYASLAQCKKEISGVEALYQQYNIPCLSSTHCSIEEISTRLLSILGINRSSLGMYPK